MNLIIDRGNTQTKIFSFSGDDMIASGIGPPPGKEKDFDWSVWLVSGKACRVIVSDVEGSFHDWDRLLSGHQVVIMSQELRFPVKLNYITPLTLGHDRIANCCGAWKLNPGQASMVIDFGTCLKIDVVDADKTFIGGSISPGLRARYRSLAEYTGRLPSLEPVKGLMPCPGTSTDGSIHCGVQNGMLAEINDFRSRYNNDHPDLNVLITGGDLEYFAAILKSPIFVAPDLTARGLNEILKLNLP